MNRREQTRTEFLSAFENFLTATAPSGSLLGVRDIRPWLWALDPSHPVLVAYARYWEANGNPPIREWSKSERNRILLHIRALPGFTREVVGHRRVGTGDQVRYVKQHANRVRV